MPYQNMDSLDLQNKRLLIREDFNVPIENNHITNDARLRAALPTIKKAIDHNAQIILMSHLGRPKEGSWDAKYSLQPVAEQLSKLLRQNVTLIKDWQNGITLKPKEIVLLENVRFLPGEEANDDQLSQQFASLCDIFVMDAFASAHRAHASTYGVARYAPIACAGPLLLQEIKALDQILDEPKHPSLAIIGGSKISTKLALLETLCQQVDTLVVGGGMANTFLAAKGYKVGRSLIEPELIPTAKTILKRAEQFKCELPLPVDAVVAKSCDIKSVATIKSINDIADDDMILDIGPKTIDYFQQIISAAKTIVWNGPVGVFEIESFSRGTEAIANAIGKSNAFSVAGGGDTIAAIEKYNVQSKLSYISTGGGAFLEMLEGKQLPALAILEQRYKESHSHGTKTSH